MFSPSVMAKGFVVGSTMMVPGVSGGSMAMVLGLYDRLVSSISGFFRDWKGNLLFLCQFGIFALLGIVLCARPITAVIDRFPVVSMFFFIGLVFGSVPMLIKESKVEKIGWKPVLSFLVGLVVVVAMAFMPEAEPQAAGEMTAAAYFWQFVNGVVIAVGFILPGISTSYLLLLLGTYSYVMTAIAELNILAIAPLGLGFIAGVLLLTRVLEICMNRFPQVTYMLITGFLIGSAVSVFPGVPRGWDIPLSILTFAAGFVIIFLISRKEAQLSDAKS